MSGGGTGLASGSGVVAGLTWEAAGVSSKGVDTWLLSMISKLEILDGGLVKGDDGG
jgi:hypothetical protein